MQSAEKTLQQILASLRGASDPSAAPESEERLLQLILAELTGIPASGAPMAAEATLGQILENITGVRSRGLASKELLVRQIAGVSGLESYERGLVQMGPVLVASQGGVTGSSDDQTDAALDDAYEKEDTGFVSTGGTVIRAEANPVAGSRYWGGARFHNGPFPPQGSTIDVAYLEVQVYSVVGDDANLDIHAQDVASPVAFAAGAFNISARARTAASVAWVDNAIGTGWKQSPSIVSVIQELVDSFTLTAIVLILKPKTDAIKPLRYRSHEQAPNDLGMKLHLEWTEP